MSFLPSAPYPPSGEGIWSPVTSTLNWCEEDYYATKYSAEIVNSFTNLMFVFLAYKGISNCIRYKHDAVFLAGFISFLVIGVGSFAFHTTLKYPMQLLDELSMVYTACIMFYAIFSHGRSKRSSAWLLLFIVALAVFITGYYHYLKDPLFHQNAFALLTALVVFKTMYAMEMTLRPSRRTKSRPAGIIYFSESAAREETRKDERDLAILKTMWIMIAVGVSCFVAGFSIWNLDNIFCSSLRRWRREIGLPWGLLLEGHGWWHIFTGFAEYLNLVWAIWIRYCLDGKQDDVELIWPSLFFIPFVAKKNQKNESEKLSKKE